MLTLLLLYMNLSLFYKTKENTISPQPHLTAFVQSFCGWMLLLFAITELLSTFYLLAPVPLFLSWGSIALFLFCLLQHQKKKHCFSVKAIKETAFLPFADLKNFFSSPFSILLVFIAGTVFYLALRTVPYNWDSMTYHLPRIVHWAENRSVAHYATNVLRQISSPVLAEFVNLHIYLLSGKQDIFLNLLQCFSFLLSAVMVYHIAKKLHCSRTFSKLAALLYLSTPIAYAEALTTQVDHFAALWLLFFVWLLLDFLNPSQKITWSLPAVVNVCTMGLCVAWGYLTKPSVCIAMVLFALWLLIVCIFRKDSVKTLLQLFFCSLPCVVLPLTPEILRNLKSFHAISCSNAGARQLVGTLHPLYLGLNLWKNVVHNLPTVILPDSSELFRRITVKLAFLLHLDLNAPAISEDGRTFFLNSAMDFGHDTAVNPLLSWLLIFTVLFCILRIRKTDWKKLSAGYTLTAILSFYIFCMFLRWEPYVTRYMISYFALICPAIAIQLQILCVPCRPFLKKAIPGTLCMLCVIGLCSMTAYHYRQCSIHHADQRPYGYFVNRVPEYEEYAALCDAVKAGGYKTVGLIIGENTYEYPLLVMLQDSVSAIEHINVTNESSRYTDTAFQPDCIICIDVSPDAGFTCNGKAYTNLLEISEGHYLLF